MGLTVAVTGPTGEIGIPAVTALEREPAVQHIVGMARRRFDASTLGWTKTTYRQGDILDRAAADALVADADVVVHLAFIIMGSRSESARINLQGTSNVFEATVAARRTRRLVYTSSVTAYGYHTDNPVPLTEDVPPRGAPEHYYSEQKVECEAALAEITAGSSLQVYLLRLVHHDDVATAIALAVTAPAPPGAYNIAGDETVTVSDVAKALGGQPVRVPAAAAGAASAATSRLPFVPSTLEWLHAARASVVMDTTKAKTQLGWRPTYSSAQTLAELAAAL